MSRALVWDTEGRIWPHRDASRFLRQGGADWHIQELGEPRAPGLLLLHGTGASVHSWAGIMPELAQTHRLIALDLPRHAFTSGHMPEDTSLPGMASAVDHLIHSMNVEPTAIIGHSAGAALALQMALDYGYDCPIIGLNSALRPFPGLAAQLFPAVAKLLFVNPFVPRLFSGMAAVSGDTYRFLEKATASKVPPESLACYKVLFENSRHTKGALAMMANWDLPTLKTRMHDIPKPVLMIHSDNDAAIPLEWAQEAHACLPTARLEVLNGLGHLAHEEAPERTLPLIRAFLEEHAAAPAQ